MERDSLDHNGKILIADDSASNRILLRAILERRNYQVDECSNGLECVEYCTEDLPRMILLDIMMPEMDGLEACKLLRSMYSPEELPIIMVTTKARGEDVRVGLEVGANDYITKPVDKQILLGRIKNQLDFAETRREIDRQRVSLERALKIQNALGDVLPDAIAVHNETGLVLYSNEPLMDACGGAVPGRIKDIIEEIYEGALRAFWEKKFEALTTDSGVVFFEEFVISEGGVRTFEVTSHPISLDDGTLLRVWLWRDLTHVRELERKIRQQVKIDTVGTFTSGISHNFNNIMGTVLGAADLLERAVGDSQRGKRCVDIIRQAITSGKILTERMTGMTRTVETRIEGREKRITSLLESIFDIQRELSGKNVTCHISGGEKLVPAVSRRSLMVLLTNVISNAFDSVKEEGGEVLVSFESGSGGDLSIVVKDNGCGMTPDAIARVCEPFYSTKNLDEKNQVSYEGNGLGMWNVLNIVRMYGGDLEIQSIPGTGTEVELRLPQIIQSEVGESTEARTAAGVIK
jgi:signal transduction histidine kinase